MMDRLIGNRRLPAGIRQDVVERTDGIPLFVEEMTKAVLEAEDEAQRMAAGVPSPALAVPSSLRASLMARLDRLGPAAKEVAQIGAAIGREFSFELLARVARSSPPQVKGSLDRTTDSGLVVQRGTPPHDTFLFKHALVRDTAYQTLLRGARRELHASIADALILGFPDPAAPELIAKHLERAERPVEAIERWQEAGDEPCAARL
jgi:predicted ATPase